MNDPPRTLAFEVVDSGADLDVPGVQDTPTIEDNVGLKLSYKQLQRLNPADRIAYARARTK